jgi:hypothetical protein
MKEPFSRNGAGPEAPALSPDPLIEATQLALELLSRLAGRSFEPVRLSLHGGPMRLQLIIEQGPASAAPVSAEIAGDPAQQPAGGPTPAPESLFLRQVHEKILAQATPTPIPAKQLARLAGYQMNSYFRDGLRQLVRWNLLRHTADGYGLPSQTSTLQT